MQTSGICQRKRTTFLFGIFTTLTVWTVAYILVTSFRCTRDNNCGTQQFDKVKKRVILTAWSPVENIKTKIARSPTSTETEAIPPWDIHAGLKKDGLNLRGKFFQWQDSKTSIDPWIGPDHVINSSKYFIYRCDMYSKRSCGGWGDRIKGIIAAYLIANLTGRVFKVELLNPPCDMAELLVPNMVNWTLPISFHKKVTTETPGTININVMGNTSFVRAIQFTNFTDWLGTEADYVYFKGNAYGIKQFRSSKIYQEQLAWMTDLSNSHVVAVIFKRLFRLSSRLNTKMKSFLQQMLPTPDHMLVCAHVRVGKNPSLPLDQNVRIKDNELPNIWNFLNKHSKTGSQSVFLMSDSEEVISAGKKQKFSQRLFVTQGVIVHVDRFSNVDADEVCAGQEKVIFDQHVLMNCDILMFGQSGLGKAAAIIRGEDEGLYRFLKGGEIVPYSLASFN